MEKLREFFTSKMGRFVITVLAAALIYGLSFLVLSTENEFVFVGIIIICAFFGWKTLGEINYFALMFASGKFIIFFYVIRVFLSIIIGVFVAPFQISKNISKKISSSLR